MSQHCSGTDAEAWPVYYYAVMVLCTMFNGMAFVLCFYAILSMVCRKEVRTNTFNIYVIFLVLPDAVYNFQSFLLGVYRTRDCGMLRDRAFSEAYDAGLFYYYFSNFFLNCMLAYELHSLLDQSHRGIRTGPPPLKRTLCQVTTVYTLTILYITWAMVDVSWSWWYRKHSEFGSPPGGIFSELQAIGMTAGIMGAFLVFVIAIRIRVWKKGLIPIHGRTRLISIFFERIILVFLVFYVPSVGLLVFASTCDSVHSPAYFWTERSYLILSALQALVTLGVVLQKPDIARAFCCGRDGFNQPRWSVVRTKGRRWFSWWWLDNGHTSLRASAAAMDNGRCSGLRPIEASSEWLMDDVYDTTQTSLADMDGEDKECVEEEDADVKVED